MGFIKELRKSIKISMSAEMCYTNLGKSVCKRVIDIHTLLKGDDLTSQKYTHVIHQTLGFCM